MSESAKIDLIITQDHSGLNAGSFFIRNSPTMRLFIDLWSDPLITERTPSWPQKEQDALNYLIVKHPQLRQRVGFIPQRLINAYATIKSVEKELLVHFAGCWYDLPCQEGLTSRVNSECVELFERFWKKRKTVSGTN